MRQFLGAAFKLFYAEILKLHPGPLFAFQLKTFKEMDLNYLSYLFVTKPTHLGTVTSVCPSRARTGKHELTDLVMVYILCLLVFTGKAQYSRSF